MGGALSIVRQARAAAKSALDSLRNEIRSTSARLAKLIAEEEKALVAKGMQIVQMGEAQKAKLHAAWSEGLWEMSAPKAKKDIDELRAFAKSKGL